MFRDVSGAFLGDALNESTGLEWGVLHTGGGCFVLEALIPYAEIRGADRLWLAGDDVLDEHGSPESFGSRVWLCLMAGGDDETQEYCVAEAMSPSGAVWNDDEDDFDIGASQIVAVVARLLVELKAACPVCFSVINTGDCCNGEWRRA